MHHAFHLLLQAHRLGRVADSGGVQLGVMAAGSDDFRSQRKSVLLVYKAAGANLRLAVGQLLEALVGVHGELALAHLAGEAGLVPGLLLSALPLVHHGQGC